MSLIRAAIPLVLLLLVVELLWSRLVGRRVYRLADSLADLGCAAMSQVLGLAVTAVTMGGYAVAAGAFSGWLRLPSWPAESPFRLGSSLGIGVRAGPLAAWVAVFLLVDLGQYLVHRLSHRVSLLWACHAVHHSSEELNYAVGLRNSSFHGFLIWVFFLPLAAAGVPWHMVVVCYGLNVLYQFWLHTRLIGRLGWLEEVLNTPSHHRVHHGRDAKYLDRNFGGVLITWDRLFGTFQQEEEEPHYGTLAPVGSWNPAWVNLHGFALITGAWRQAVDWRGRLRAVLGPPEALEEAGEPARPPVAPSLGLALYCAAQLSLAIAATVGLVLPGDSPRLLRLVTGALVLATLAVLGGLLDGRRWAPWVEGLRLSGMAVAAACIPGDPTLRGGAIGAAVMSFYWLRRARPQGIHTRERHRTIQLEGHLVADPRQGPEVRRKHEPDHATACASTEPAASG
jgi:sterol desaturase/sphingolipid hydroxylase (fatty acid hydroxylase superfamily)